MKDKILAKVEECFIIAETFYRRTFDRPTNIIFKETGTVGCHSNYSQRELMFNIILASQNEDDFLNDTVPHEVAHYVQRAVYGYGPVKPHGREWKYIMTKVFGLNPTRCHSYDPTSVAVRRQTRHEYACPCGCKFEISSTTHNKIQKSIKDANKYGFSTPMYRKICKKHRQTIYLVNEGDATKQRIDFLTKKLEALKQLKMKENV